MPGQEFYELKHRAIQWMIDPVDDGGLGLDPQTVATMVGHDDGGYLISTVYTKLSEKRAHARAQRAMDAYQQRIQDPTNKGKTDDRGVIALQKNRASAAKDLQRKSPPQDHLGTTRRHTSLHKAPIYGRFGAPTSRHEPVTQQPSA
jgi:hypothetical protein